MPNGSFLGHKVFAILHIHLLVRAKLQNYKLKYLFCAEKKLTNGNEKVVETITHRKLQLIMMNSD